MSQSGGGILPLYHSRPFSLSKKSRDKRILFVILFIFSFICFSWLFLIPDSGSEPHRSYEQVYGDFAPHISNRIHESLIRPPIPLPPVTAAPPDQNRPQTDAVKLAETETKKTIEGEQLLILFLELFQSIYCYFK